MEQLMIPGMSVLPKGYLPCANPELVTGYVSIQKILEGDSGDFDRCWGCNMALCEHHLDEKREDRSYRDLVEHFQNGGMMNQPVCYMESRYSGLSLRNGHHRLAAALDAGFTHIPFQTAWGENDDWDEKFITDNGFTLTTE